jgi:hypothetical protein
MRVPKADLPVRIDVPGAVARQLGDFGDAGPSGPMAAEWFSLGAGTDIAPLLEGLEGDACQAPHWGFVQSGRIVVTYTSGAVDECMADDFFHWPPGHSVRVEEDAEVLLFSPHREHAAVMDHMRSKMGL